jgi:hypothetical protein
MTANEAMHEIWGTICPDCGPDNYEFIAAEVAKLRAQVDNAYVDVVFDGPPGPDPPTVVELENEQGRSMDFGRWVQRTDGRWAFRLPVAPRGR